MSKLLFCYASLSAFLLGVTVWVYLNLIPDAMEKSFCVGPVTQKVSLYAITSKGVQAAEPVSNWSCFVWDAHTNKG